MNLIEAGTLSWKHANLIYSGKLRIRRLPKLVELNKMS